MAEHARSLVGTRYEDLDPRVIANAKRHVLDTIGGTLAGTRAEACQSIIDLVSDWGGRPESTVVGASARVPAPNAILANATMARALELDAVHEEAFLHPTATVVPVALALAERQGNISGREFLTAVVLAVDLTVRLSLAPRIGCNVSGMSFNFQCGTFGAAAAAGRMLGLDEERMLDALALAYSQAAGNQQTIFEGTLAVRTQQGLSAQAGAVAAILAERDVTGPRDILEGKYGYYPVYHRGEYDRSALQPDHTYAEINSISIKPYPCCRFNHQAIKATLNLVRRHDIGPDDIVDVTVEVNNISHFNIVCEPLEVKQQPRTPIDAQFSIPYTVATAIARRRVFLEDFTEQAIADPVVVGLARRVHPTIDPSVERSTGRGAYPPSVVTMTLKNGRRLTERLEYPPGSPSNPLSDDELLEKFMSCAAWAARPLPASKLTRITELVAQLDQLDDVRELAAMLGT